MRTIESGDNREPKARTYTDAAEADRVRDLPGWGAVDFGLFAGYVTVDEDHGRSLFYAFAESKADPSTSPLLVWVNGGPGCSSIGGGFMSELGPFLPLPGGAQLSANHHAWNNLSNVIFLDSPAFVGFSYSNTSDDLVVGDERTAKDARLFLLGFLEKFPQYRKHDLYLSGESYGGHYVPNLALEIVRANARHGPGDSYLNLKGFLVGNPWTDAAIDNRGAVEFWWTHGMISDESRNNMNKYCNFSIIGPLARSQQLQDAVPPLEAYAYSSDTPPSTYVSDPDSWRCHKAVARAFNEFNAINIYDIYVDVCTKRGVTRAAQRLVEAAGGLLGSLGGHYDPCVDDEVEQYLNRAEVQAALHANTSGQLPWPWQDCNHRVRYSRDDLLSSMLPVYDELLETAPQLKVLIYSGDIDAIVPLLGTRVWVRGVAAGGELRPWRQWFVEDGQVGGWIVDYEGISLATVRGAGHMVPYTQPQRGFHLLRTYFAKASEDATTAA